MNIKKSKLFLAIQAISILSAATTGASKAFAQNDNEEVTEVEEVIVTGSRLRKANLVSAAPVTQIDAEEVRFQGVVRVEDMLRNVPQIYASQSSGVSNGATGTATINLRNLGTARTLVLVNGKRLPAGSPISGGIGADINQIPAALIETAEIQTGGASAIYGSDAVAGVVNFKMKTNFEGIEFDAQSSFYSHDNDNDQWQQLNQEAGYDYPSGRENDGDTRAFSLIVGGNFDSGKGNVTAYASKRNIDPVVQASRDYSTCALDYDSSDGSFTCQGSGTVAEGRVTDFSDFDFVVDGTDFVDHSGQTFNYGPLNYFQRPDERVTLGTFAHYDINSKATAYAELMYMDNQSVAQIAPAGSFFNEMDIECSNPLLSEQQFQQLCGQFGLTREDSQTAFVAKRNVEGGNRQDDLRHTSHRLVFGLKGDLDDTWSYDVSYLFSQVSMERTYLNDMSKTRILRSLDVVADTRGNPVCRSALNGVDTNCVPWQVFNPSAITQEQIDYLSLPLFARGTTEQDVFTAHISGDLGNYGIKLPTADTGIAFAVGFESRSESLEFNPDQGFQSGDGAGQGGPTKGVSGRYSTDEYFLEASIPMVESKPFVESLALDLAYRNTSYSYGISADTYGLGLGWEISSDIKLRISQQKAIRGANIREFFNAESLGLFNMSTDPCGGELDASGRTAAGRTLEECQRTGVTEEQFGSIANNPAGQYNHQTSGSADLKPEEADTFTLGLVFTPSFIENLSFTLDYYDIKIKEGIKTAPAASTITQCLDGNDALCQRIHRADRTGSLWLSDDGYVEAPNQNLAVEHIQGYDLITEYDWDLGELGNIHFNNVMTYTTTWDAQVEKGGAINECVGFYSEECGPTLSEVFPKIRNNLRSTWETPWGLTASVALRHIDSIKSLSDEGLDMPSITYTDLSLIWEPLDSVSMRAGINNLFDRTPPIVGSSLGDNGNTFPGVYDALGQYAFTGITLKF